MADLVVHCVCFVLVVLLNLVAVQCWTRGADEQHPVSDFSRHIVVKPRIYHGREKRQISTTKEEGTGKHIDHLIITLPVEGEDLTLDLVLNRQLIPKNYFKKYQENGSHKIVRPSEDEIELCHYNGKIRGYPESWVALSTCRGLSGVIFDGSEMYYVEKGPTENLEEEENSIDSDSSAMEATHYFYKHSDLAPHNKSCGYGGDAVDPDKVHSHTHNRMLRYKRSTEQNDNIIRGPYNANKESKYVELVLVVDNREFKELGEKTSNVEKHCTNIANIINALYAPLNIYIALVGVVIWTEHDEISFSTNGDTTLTNFLHYRREKLVKEHPNDNAQLLTKMNFENGVVGKALKGPMCTYEYSGGVNTDHSVVVGLVATTVAHEMGHNFGMEHDTNECQCPEDRCIMAPSSSSVAPTHWSSCSLNYLLLAFTHGMDYCLKNKPAALFDSPVCGNGFVEPGEQCDCGLQEHCDNPCCDASTCMLYSNASCATGECCDLNTCKPKNAGTLCRSADYECDLPEYCTGQSEYCPADIYKMDTEVCDHGKAFCYHGFCRTRTDQCKLLWGETGKSSDEQCYKMNVKGTRHGNCGYNKFNQSFFKCHDDNVLCGMLHCKHFNEKLEFGMESVSILSHSFINLKGSVVACRTAIVDLGINQVDPGLAPDGARCGEDKMCVNQKCMPVSSLRMAANICPHDCNGNGWCNNLGHCHCKEGFAPPFCENPGHGGSEDSGPASDPNAHKEFVAALFIIFLGIIPTLLIFAFVVYYLKRNGLKLRKPKMLMMMRSTPGAAGGGRGVPPPISKTPPKSRTGAPFSSDLAKRPEDNHSLLQPETATTSPPGAGFKNEFFGNFNGFTLTPMKKSPSPEVVRSAPAPPVVPNPKQNVGRSNTNAGSTRMNSLLNKSVARAQSFKNNITGAIASVHSASAAPAAPPPPPPPLFTGIPTEQQKPVISSPILENSTCTAKELISPLRNASQKGTFRAAPEVPATAPPPLVTQTVVNIKENQRPLSTPDSGHSINLNSASAVVPEEMPRKPKDSATNNNGTLHRITSFLKPADKKPGALSKNQQQQQQVKASKILDKNALRSMPISNPIPQSQNTTALPIKALPVNTEEGRAVVMRAQSMRGGKVTQRPNIPNFGSMRQPNGGGASRRPVSIPSGVRPKSPPPPRPPGAVISEANNNPGSKITIPSLPGYQKPASNANHQNKTSASNNNHQYDDCLNKQTIRMDDSTDNIYAVIEESPMVSPEKTKNKGSSGSSTEDMGLLTEIVSEIQNRNFDSIYSTSTLARKKKQQQEDEEREQQIKSPSESEASYVNTSSLYKSPEGSYYSNMSNLKSSASSTSSGYIQPSMVNVPTIPAMKENKPEKAGKSSASNNSNVNSNKPPSLKTFKSDDSNSASTSSSASNNSTRPFGSTFAKPPGRLQSLTNSSSKPSSGDSSKTVKSPPSPSGGGGKTTPKSLSRQTTPTSLNRQTTPPNLSRQTTPTSLQTRKPSPTRPSPPVVTSGTSSRSKTIAVANNKSANSPDVVSSCNNKALGTTKPPDLVNNNSGASHTASINKKPSISSAKPIGAVSVPTKTQSKFGGTTTNKSVSFKASSAQDPSSNAANKKSPGEIGKTAAITNNLATKPGGVLGTSKGVERKTSNVASLQQKFENKTATSPNSKSVVKAKT